MSEKRVGEHASDVRGIGHTICGLVAAPVIGGMIAAPLMVLLAGIPSPASSLPAALHVSLFAGLITGASIGIPTALIVGFPIYLLMKRLGMINRHHYVFVGGLIALLPSAVMAGSIILSSPAFGIMVAVAIIFAGIVGGVIFWSIRRPDLDVPISASRNSPQI